MLTTIWKTALAALVAGLAALGVGGDDNPPVRELYECPDHWDSIPVFRRGTFEGMETGSIAVAGINTIVPEFHDCQRLVRSVGTKRIFTTLAAVFASESLPHMEKLLGSPRSPVAGRWFGAAEIVAMDSAYSPLGVSVGYNCLFLYYRSDRLKARIVPVQNERTCLRTSALPEGEGKEFDVKRWVKPGYGPDDYPPVARWDLDPRTGLHYIGLGCGAGWCEIGAGPNGGSNQPSVPSDVGEGMTSNERRRLEIKGWFDAQWLALGALPGSNAATVSPLFGRIYPDPDLGSQEDFSRKWVPVATVRITSQVGSESSRARAAYRDKYGFTPGGPNQVFLCEGTPADTDPSTCLPPAGISLGGALPAFTASCEPGADHRRWWALIISTEGNAKIKCATRRDHEHAGIRPIPGLVRWHWDKDDDPLWARCKNYGCCQIN